MSRQQAELLAARIRAAGWPGTVVEPSGEGEWAVRVRPWGNNERLLILDPLGWEVMAQGATPPQLSLSL